MTSFWRLLTAYFIVIANTGASWDVGSSCFQEYEHPGYTVACSKVDSIKFKTVYNQFDGYYSINKLIYTGNVSRIFKNEFVNSYGLRELVLQNIHLKSVDDNSFAKLSNLNKLDLSRNYLSSLGYMISGLNNLVHLNLSGNPLSKLSGQPFKDLYHLNELDLSNTNISKLSENTFNGLSNLISLNLENSNVIEIERKAFNGLNALQVLDLSSNSISNLTSLSFSGLPALSNLDLSHNSITNIEPDALNGLRGAVDLSGNKLVLRSKSFQGAESLNELKLSNNSITNIPVGIFNNMVQLQILNLSNNNIQFDGVGNFHGLSNLAILDLSFNNLTQLVQFTFQPLENLKTLILDGNVGLEFNFTFVHVIRSLHHLSFGSTLRNCVWVSNLKHFLKMRNIQLISTYEKIEYENHVDHVGCILDENYRGITEVSNDVTTEMTSDYDDTSIKNNNDKVVNNYNYNYYNTNNTQLDTLIKILLNNQEDIKRNKANNVDQIKNQKYSPQASKTNDSFEGKSNSIYNYYSTTSNNNQVVIILILNLLLLAAGFVVHFLIRFGKITPRKQNQPPDTTDNVPLCNI